MAETALNNKDRILETIDQLRKRKARPDLERISHMLERRYAVSCTQTEADLAKLVAEAVVIKVDYKGSTSYRNAAKWGRRNSACPGPQPQLQPLPETPPTAVAPPTEPATPTAVAAAKIAEEAAIEASHSKNDGNNQSNGVCVESIANYLSTRNKQNAVKVNKNSLQLSLNREVSAGRLKKLSTGRYVCVQPFVQPPLVTSSQIVVLAVTSAAAAAAGKANVNNGNNSEQAVAKGAQELTVNNKLDECADVGVGNTCPTDDDEKRNEVPSFEAEKKTPLSVEIRQPAPVFQPPLTPPPVVSRCQSNAAARKNSRHPSSSYHNKRKRFKKTHGPDFVEDYDSSFEETADTKCDYCLLTADCNRNGEREELLVCKECLAKAHPSCMDYSKELAARSHMSPWQCMDCKTCFICNGSGDGNTMLFCDSCDKGYHMGCHQPKVVTKPTGKWMCRSCCSEQEAKVQDRKPSDASEKVAAEEEDEEEDEAENRNDRCDSPAPAENGFSLTEEESGTSEDIVMAEVDSPILSLDGSVGLSNTPFDSPVPCEEKNWEAFRDVLTFENNIHGQVDHVKTTNWLVNGHEKEAEIPDASNWSIEDVVKYFKSAGFPEQALAFGDQEIDGKSLLLMTRNDVLTGLAIKLGPALKIYNHVRRLQKRLDDSSIFEMSS